MLTDYLLTTSRLTWGTASRRGPREHNADAVSVCHDATNDGVVFAIADGIGDTVAAGNAARLAARVAATTPITAGPAEAVLAAQRALASWHPMDRDDLVGDCVLLVAMPNLEPAGGYRMAWAGDCRAYRYDGETLEQLTTDHTLAEYLRARKQPVTPRMEHIVTATARTSEVGAVSEVVVHSGFSRLLLTTDGVHKTLGGYRIQELLARDDMTPTEHAAALVDTAERYDGTDNATAIVVSAAALRAAEAGAGADADVEPTDDVEFVA